MSQQSSPDLVIRNGLVADGLGAPLRRADVAISGDRIVAVGEVEARGAEEIDAGGALVTPGFVDVHTHYDGQAVWAQRFSPSSAHGVTTVVMGNCGVGFAPCRPEDHEVLVSVMEGVEDVPEIVMTTGLDWSWETFPQFLDTLEQRPHDIDFGVYLPHSPLRVYVMGDRGVRREEAQEADLERMREITREAMRAGALGFATSSVPAHRTGQGEFIPSFQSAEAEYLAIAGAMTDTGRGVFQMVLDQRNPADADRFVPMLERISDKTGRTVTFTLTQMMDGPPDAYRSVLAAVSEANRKDGVEIRPQVFPRPMGMLLGIDLTLNPFSLCPSYEPLLKMSVADRVAALRDPDLRARLLVEQPADPKNPLFVIARDWKRLYPFRTPADYEPPKSASIAALAEQTGVSPEDIAYDLLLENDGAGMILAAITNYAEATLDAVFEMITHEDTVVALGDGGAHYGLICDASFPTFMLTHWARDRGSQKIELSEAVEALTSRPARLVGLEDRGVIAPGYKADINIIDLDRLQLRMPHIDRDLPGGGRRLNQGAVGYRATLVSGKVIQRDGVPTDALPGRLIRGPQPLMA
ncbi:amidohydrolase family protein [Sphingomonas sp. C8-2]|uniref:N-acyl-D-amino-acid deacylase family protein n=1 Tax=Rhizorhabdus histidinilytica TaxID=439228 RepID=UPI000F7AC690|nr:amidohydrolase family protein [Sphingomonas sp. C8-2]